MLVLFGGDNLKCFFSIERTKNASELYQLNDVLNTLLKPKKHLIREDIKSLIFEEMESIKWHSFIAEIRYWFETNSKKMKSISYTFSNGRSHYSAQFVISKQDFSDLLSFIKKINSEELGQFWLFENCEEKKNI